MAAIEHTHPVPPEELMAFADGELRPPRAQAVEAHVAQCIDCRQAVAELREVSSELARWTVEDPPVMRAPSAIPPKRSLARRFFVVEGRPVWQSAAAFVVVVGLIAVWLGQSKAPARREARAGYVTALEPTVSGGASERGGGGPGRAAASTVAQSPQGDAPAPSSQSPGTAIPRPPQVVRRASLALVVKDVEGARSAIDRIVHDVSGFVGEIQIASGRGDIPGVRATLRIPATRMDQALTALRSLGRVSDESQSGEDVTDQMIDLDARLTNGRNTEKRLTEVLKNRTGDLADVLAVEREVARVREEIEQLDAQRKTLEQRVSFATVTLTVTEERQAQLDPGGVPVHSQLRNAFVEGLQAAYESALSVAIGLLHVSPFLLLWTIVLWWPARRAYRAWRSIGPASAQS
jgi:hypothetical protein